MLSQRSIQVWEGSNYSQALPHRENHHVTTKNPASCSASLLREWKPFSLQRGRSVKVRLVICSSPGIQSPPVAPLSEQPQPFVRSQLRLDGESVRIASSAPMTDARGGNDCNPGLDFAPIPTRKVSLRSPAPLPEGISTDPADSELVELEESSRSVDFSPSVAQDVRTIQNDADARNVSPPKNAFEIFARARAAGRELAKRTKDGTESGLGLGPISSPSEYYYTPVVGDYVLGIVTSGTFSRLDIDIGAKELGHLFRKDVMPLDLCNTCEMSWELPGASDGMVPPSGIRFICDEEERVEMETEGALVVEQGTVMNVEVKGMTPSGRALLSARSVAREYAWQRIRQLYEYNATLEVQITEWTTAGLITKIEGLRAFLPTYYLVNHVPEPSPRVSVCYKDYVGKKFTVMINSVDETRSNVVISEKKAWITKNAYIGALVEGAVTEIHPYGFHLRIKNTDISGVLHISNISRARVVNIETVFSLGEEVKMMVVPSNAKRRLSFSTADLESEHGLILRDKEAVFQGAEKIAAEIAKRYKIKQPELAVDNNGIVEVVDKEVANWDWLDFGDQAEQD